MRKLFRAKLIRDFHFAPQFQGDLYPMGRGHPEVEL